MAFHHFYVGMPLHKRASALGDIQMWVTEAAREGERFCVRLGERGVVSVESQRKLGQAKFARLLTLAGLVGVYEGLGLSVDAPTVVEVMDDVCAALYEAAL